MKTIIAGSRSFNDYNFLERAIKKCGFQITEVVCGEARGVDTLGKKWALKHDIPVKSFPADWGNLDIPGALVKENKYGLYNARAGHYRNQQMADYSEALIAIWDGKSPGTKNMIQSARKMGFVVKVFII